VEDTRTQLLDYPITQLPHSTSVIVPAFNEAASIGALVGALRAAATWGEILVVDDGSQDETAARAQMAGARVIHHPYNKGNGAAVKTGIRNATGVFILIIDADGQHRPADALRLVGQLDMYDLVVGARSTETQATALRRYGNAMLNWTASYLTARPIPDLTSGFRAARRECMLEFCTCFRTGSRRRPRRRWRS
jgi:glycosyltransferase involved in cell wall biosynthesis